MTYKHNIPKPTTTMWAQKMKLHTSQPTCFSFMRPRPEEPPSKPMPGILTCRICEPVSVRHFNPHPPSRPPVPACLVHKCLSGTTAAPFWWDVRFLPEGINNQQRSCPAHPVSMDFLDLAQEPTPVWCGHPLLPAAHPFGFTRPPAPP